MNTVYLLMAQFDKAIIPLEEIAQPYLGFSARIAVNKHNRGELGLPCFRLNQSQKSPLVVRVQDLAAYIDTQAEQAQQACLKSAI